MVATLPDDVETLLELLGKRDRRLAIRAEMKVGSDNPQIEEHLEELLEASIAKAGPAEETITIPKQAASWLLEMLKARPGRKRFGRHAIPADDIGRAVIFKIAGLYKAELVSSGISPTKAHAAAADRAERLAGAHGTSLAASTIAGKIRGPKFNP
jgi:hypothetical protein